MKLIKGNIIDLGLDGTFDVIIQGCNCFNTMGAGLARELKERIPSVYLADQATQPGDPNKLGRYTYTHVISKISNRTLVIINAYTQYDYRGSKPCDYDAIRKVFRLIRKDFTGSKFGIPKIGAGLAGGNWGKIHSIIEEEMGHEDLTLVQFEG